MTVSVGPRTPKWRCRRCGTAFVSSAHAARHVNLVHPPVSGVLEWRIAESTATLVSIRSAPPGFGISVVCENHGQSREIDSLLAARSDAADPAAWCPDCGEQFRSDVAQDARDGAWVANRAVSERLRADAARRSR